MKWNPPFLSVGIFKLGHPVFAGFINLARPLVTCFLGFVVYHWIEVMGQAPSLLPDQQDRAFPFALQVFAPSGLRGIVLAGFIAAVMSTVSALSNAVGTIFSLNVYRRVCRPEPADRELIRAGRIAAGTARTPSKCRRNDSTHVMSGPRDSAY